MGIAGAAIATFIAYGVLSILTLMIGRRDMEFDLELSFIPKNIFSSAIMVLCIWLINPHSIIAVTISIFVGAVIYFGILLLTKGLGKREIRFFVNFAKDNLRKFYWFAE